MFRRESLAAVAGAAATLAGCTGLPGSSGEATSTMAVDSRDGGGGAGGRRATDPDMVQVRVDSDRQPVWLLESDAGDGGRGTARRDERFLGDVVVDTAARAERIAVADEVDETAIRSLLDATDFATETVYLESLQVDSCFRLTLCQITWSDDEVSTDYARLGRPYDEPCAVDERVFETRLIRIPAALDADRVTGASTSVGGGGCRRRRRAVGREHDATTVTATSSTDSTTTTETDARSTNTTATTEREP
jgi:hypothetical protein